MSRRPPTIRDVAREAGVGTTTVSRVINGRPKVKAETAQRIEEAIRALGFRPNRLANSFRNRSLSMIGMVVPDPAPAVFANIADTVDEYVTDQGFVVVSATSRRNAERERALVRSFIERGADGVLLITEDDDHSYLEADLDHGYPLVFVSDPPSGVRAPAVIGDERGGSQAAIEHLVRHGHRRIGVIGSTGKPSTAERLAGCEATLAAHGIEIDPALVRVCSASPDDGQTAMTSLLSMSRPPTAIFSTNYPTTMGALKALRGNHPPVALICFGDFEAATLLNPEVTVVTSDPKALGSRAAELLLSRMAGTVDRDAHVIVPPRLIARGSGEVRIG